MESQPRWLPSWTGVPPVKDDPDNDGSCVVAKAAGRYFGVAKRANVVIAKLTRNDDSTVLEALFLVFADIEAHAARARHFVVALAFRKFSWELMRRPNANLHVRTGLTRQQNDPYIALMRTAMRDMIEKYGVIFVTGAGEVTVRSRSNHSTRRLRKSLHS